MIDLIQECSGARRIGISGHVRPDGDCVGSCMALYLYLKKKFPETEIKVYLEKPADIFAVLKGVSGIDSLFEEDREYDVFFALDCNEDRLGPARKYFEKAGKTINIDHHISNMPGCGDVNEVHPDASATAEVLYGLIDRKDMDRDIATALYIGLIHDTGVFQYSNTTPETMRAGADLITFGFDFPKLIQETFYEKTPVQTRILGKVLTECTGILDGRAVVGYVDRKTMESYGADPKDLEGIVSSLRNIKGIDCAVFVYETEKHENKVSLRSTEKVDVAEIASRFGGGGHVRAAGCTVEGTFSDCIRKISDEIEKQLFEEPDKNGNGSV